MGPPRHLSLLAPSDATYVNWPVPYAEGLTLLRSHRGRCTVVLASGDPFWFGAGSVLAREFAPDEWRALPGRSTFALAASQLGWPLETTLCTGLHAAPISRLRPHLADGQRAIVLLRDGAAVGELAEYLTNQGFGDSVLHVAEALGGPRERIRRVTAAAYNLTDVQHPVCAGVEMAGGPALPHAAGRADSWFDHDGQITKRPARALTLSALAPCAGQALWDIGGGSGSIAIEWLLSAPGTSATCFEADATRANRITENARALGVDHLKVVHGRAPECLGGHPAPDAVFIGGGLSEGLLTTLWRDLPPGTRIVANAVTLESAALLVAWRADKGGDLLRIELSHAAPIGGRTGWKAAYPLVQWSVVR